MKPDPRIMMLTAACFSTMGIAIATTWLLGAVFLLALMFSLLLGVKILPIVKRLRGLISMVVFVALMESVFAPAGAVLFELGGVKIITVGGLLKGANTLLRIGIIISAASVFTLVTVRETVQGMIQIRIPYEIAFMASVALRFLPVLSEEFRDTLTAIQLRGVEIKKIPLGEKIRTYISIIAPVVYGTIDRAQKLAYAMELRAFRALPKRTSRFVLKFKLFDYVYLAVFPALTAAILYINFAVI